MDEFLEEKDLEQEDLKEEDLEEEDLEEENLEEEDLEDKDLGNECSTDQDTNPEDGTEKFGCQTTERESSLPNKKICETCNKQYKAESNFRYVLGSHPDSYHYKCDLCPDSFKSLMKLIDHHQIHFSSESFHCTCDNKVKVERNLSKYMQSGHKTMDKPVTVTEKFQCDLCDKFCNTKGHLKLHLRQHLEIRPRIYQCLECPKAFMDRDALKKHMRTHILNPHTLKSHKCSQCGAGFKVANNVKRHLRENCPAMRAANY